MSRRKLYIPILLALVTAVGCGEGEKGEEEKVDPRIERIRAAERIVFDSWSADERVYAGEELQTFLNGFEPDTFDYGPTSVRLVSGCHGGTMRIGTESFLLSLCRLKNGRGRLVLSVGMSDGVVRLVEKEE